MRLINKRTLLVMELKPVIAEGLGLLNNELAQLFLEIYYAWEEDHYSRNCNYENILGILSDKFMWHIFDIDVQLPMKVKHYYFVHNPEIQQICMLVQTLLPQIETP